MDILMVAPEMAPYAKSGGLADVARALPLALSELGERVSVIIPCYRGVVEKFKAAPAGVELIVPIFQGDHYIDKRGEILETVLDGGVRVYLVRMDEYYDREHLYSTPSGDYQDNCARFTFFCRAALELMKARQWRPDIIHCHDWQSALVPIYLKTLFREDPLLADARVVFTVHNLGYQGLFWHWDMKLIGLPWEFFGPDHLEYYGKLNLLKGALVFSDKITTVSKNYAREIQTPEYGYGLDGVVRERASDLTGIMNGIDYAVWDPATDPRLAANYSIHDLEGKARCKEALQKELGLPQDGGVPLLACISRLTDQKGIDLLYSVMEDLMKKDVQFAMLGEGEERYKNLFRDLGRFFPDRASVTVDFDEGLAHRIEAGADMFLMPSRYEPCGLNQMISKKYGAVPVVRATGGLEDTVTQWDKATGEGNGFKFMEYSSKALLEAVNAALACYRSKETWTLIMRNGMKDDHSWTSSAKEYLRVYREAAGK